MPLAPADRTWLLVDLGAGLLEEANAQDVVAELLPDLPPEDQAEIVAGLWEVSHPGVTNFLTALSQHGLGRKDIVPNINWFMRVPVTAEGGAAIASGV